jgi:hypothetical protein
MTEMKIPEVNPYKQAKATTSGGELAESHMARQKGPDKMSIGFRMFRRPSLSAA